MDVRLKFPIKHLLSRITYMSIVSFSDIIVRSRGRSRVDLQIEGSIEGRFANRGSIEGLIDPRSRGRFDFNFSKSRGSIDPRSRVDRGVDDNFCRRNQ